MKYKILLTIAWIILIVWDLTGPTTTMGSIRPISLIVCFWILVVITLIRYIMSKYKVK